MYKEPFLPCNTHHQCSAPYILTDSKFWHPLQHTSLYWLLFSTSTDAFELTECSRSFGFLCNAKAYLDFAELGSIVPSLIN